MEITIEQVEKLQERTNVSYAEAKNALEHTNGDLLEAVIYLENAGRVFPNGGSFQGNYGTPGNEYLPPNWQQPVGNTIPTGYTPPSFWERMGNAWKIAWAWLSENYVVVKKQGTEDWKMPFFMVLLLIIFGFYFIIPLAIIGLLVGYRYSLKGRDMTEKVNVSFETFQSVIYPEEPGNGNTTV